MDSKSAAKLAFGNPGFLDTIVDIVSPIHLFKSVQAGIYGQGAQDVAAKIQPLLAQAPLIGGLFTPAEDEAEDDPLGEDGDY